MHYADEKLKYSIIYRYYQNLSSNYRTFQLTLVRLSFGFGIQLLNLSFETSSNKNNSIFGITGNVFYNFS